jgi:hypothetical protein
MTALDLIKSSLRLINVLASGETPTADEAQDSLMVLNQMVDAWNAERLMVFTISIAEYSLVVGQQVYTLGPGGNFNAPRPSKIERIDIIYLANPNQPLELKLDYLTDAQWAAIPVKNIPTTLPRSVYDDGAYPLRNLSFWGVPTVISDIKVYSWQALTQFAVLTSNQTFPPGYFEALRYNLAIRLAPEFNESASPDLQALAMESKAKIKSINIPIVDLRVDSALTGGGAAYDWRSDSVVGSSG